jgi:hypothetical protein
MVKMVKVKFDKILQIIREDDHNEGDISQLDWNRIVFSQNEGFTGVKNAFGIGVPTPATIVIDNTGEPVVMGDV